MYPAPRPIPRAAAGLAAALVWLATGAATADTCLRNATDRTLFLVADTGGDRAAGPVPPGGEVCAAGPAPDGRATVSVFLSETDLEGCSRRVADGARAAIAEFQGVDLCLWLD